MAADFTRDQLRHQRERPLSRASEFQHIKSQVVGFDDSGERATFAQGRNVPGGRDGSQHSLH